MAPIIGRLPNGMIGRMDGSLTPDLVFSILKDGVWRPATEVKPDVTVGEFFTSKPLMESEIEALTSSESNIASFNSGVKSTMKDIILSIVADYGEVIEKVSQGGNLLYPESFLPYPKERIRTCLKVAHHLVDDNMKSNLSVALNMLDDFIPDTEVPKDSFENSLEWNRRRGQRGDPGDNLRK